MTTPFSSSSQAAPENFDTGPLSWVMGEIREALARSKAALHQAVIQDAESQVTSMHHAKAYLHQAHGALQVVDIDGVSIITETVEDLFDRIDTGQLMLSEAIAQTIDNAYQALVEYLEELLSGAAHQPVRLFPYYRALLETRGAERIHPADLFFPNLAIRPQLPPAHSPIGKVDYVSLRKRFERALLPFLKSTDSTAVSAHASAMRGIISEVECAQANQQARGFWWVMHGFAEAVASGQVRNEIYIKQLFARINLQLRRLSEGSPSIAERLLRDALFFIARAENPSPRVLQIRTAYELGGLVPTDYEKKRYGQIDVDALVAAKERLAQVKNYWNRIATGDTGAADQFETEMTALAEACSRLNSPSLFKLLRELNGIARHAARPAAGDSIGLEIATGLLFVENALNNLAHLPENFAERADALTARLLSIVSGETPSSSAKWLDDMSREAQQRQTMMVLATEMQSSLRQVEKMLDEYFNDMSRRENLVQVEPVLHQIGGALAILDQEDALQAVQHTSEAVRHFSDAEVDPDREEFQKVARNLGALSFFIETLQLNSEGARKRFSFDAEQGVFHAKLIEKAPAPPAPMEADEDLGIEPISTLDNENSTAEALVDAVSADLPTVEDELAYYQQQSAELAASLSTQPDNPVLQEQLKESLEQVRLDATLVDNPEANDRARAAIDILDRPDFGASQEAMADIISVTVPVHVSQEPVVTAPAPSTDEAIDAELLEIFLSEAEEVIACIRETIPQSRSEPYNQDHLTTLRRSFHTLKGSSRMVGLAGFGEAAWGIEQVLNLRLSETRPGDTDLYALLEQAADVLGAWTQDLKEYGKSGRTPDALVRAAERVKAGEPFVFEAMNAAMPVAQDTPPDEPQLASGAEENAEDTPLTTAEPEEVTLSDADMALFQNGEACALDAQSSQSAIEQPATQKPAVALVADVIEFPTVRAPQPKQDDSVKYIGELQISVPLHNIYLAESDELIRLLSQDMAEWRHEPDRHVNVQAVHASHSLAGSSATVGFKPMREIAHALEAVLQYLARRPIKLEPRDYDVLDHALERVRFMLQMFALGEMPDHEAHQVEILELLLQELEGRLALPAESHTTAPAAGKIDSAGDQTILSSEQPAADAVMVCEPVHATPVREDDQVPEQAPIQESAGQPSIEVISESAVAEPMEESVTEPGEVPAIAPGLAAPFAEPVFENQNDSAADPALILKDDLDADLMPVFLEEGRDMLPQIGHALRTWQGKPADTGMPQSLLRFLHTIKGSARMAGAMALGQHLHEMETRIEQLMRLGVPSSAAFDDLLARYDLGLHMFEMLQTPDAGQLVPVAESGEEEAPSTSTATKIDADTAGESVKHEMVVLPSLMPVPVDKPAAPPSTPQVKAATPIAPAPLVRVRADILDRLVNQAGEVSISRSKLETEVGTLRQSLTELSENVARLRDQLREIEMQAESQITSRMAHAADREFDPLEFDRFTRLQELTRMMAESVNDVGSVQQNLTRTLDTASTDLTTQARLTRDLQQDLMRVRMVQFASISERLYRVTRQASKEVNKRVNLDIRGSAVEVDRGVLEKMIGPFEHLLRNAIVHGIESREARLAAGKDEIGELLVEIRQEGNEVVIQFSDDGQGLNIGRIREKAKAIGLLNAEGDMSDAEVSDLIFHPGFSTAVEVTELAGRGIGMDVVRSEAAALGGRVSMWSESGKGTHFTIHLPLTLAVTQVVLLTTGGRTYAVPSVLVEQVQQLKAHMLTTAYNDGAVMWQGQRVPMHYLATLLGDKAATAVAQQYSPILILRSGNDRVAIHVDEILGNREVVVKNIGPQLARMIGIAGATVLGSGDIVLILNPVPLAQRAAHENVRAPRMLPSDAPEGMGAVAEIAATQPIGPMTDPVQGLRTQHIIMVVDDSLTVRRVTQRLLVREGYQVVLAKDGVDALEHLQSITPDVMLVDIEMPRMDGFDLTRNVRSDERTRHIPIIMITSRTATKHRNYAMELGVNEYLGKPYQEEALLKLITEFVNKEAPVA